MALETEPSPLKKNAEVQELDQVIIRFAGDSGDGMQLTGSMFTQNSALVGNDISTLPDFPAEIRAPAGTLPGVSGFQLNFSSFEIMTPGDAPAVLVAMNPAALKVNLKDLVPGGLVIINEDTFRANNLKKAGYETDPREGNSLDGYQVVSVPLTTQTQEAVKDTGISHKMASRCKNMYALGVMFWLYDRPLDDTEALIEKKFSKKPEIAAANKKALRAGYNFAETTELFQSQYRVGAATLAPGRYRMIMGNQATAMGFITAAHVAKKELFYGSYPITPASDVLHELSRHKSFGVKTFQAEDEIAAIGAVIGAAFAGSIAVTGTSGPGLALKSEALGLAVMTELPIVIINVQRGGPSTGLPTKTEQSDLLQVLFGRNGECPVVVPLLGRGDRLSPAGIRRHPAACTVRSADVGFARREGMHDLESQGRVVRRRGGADRTTGLRLVDLRRGIRTQDLLREELCMIRHGGEVEGPIDSDLPGASAPVVLGRQQDRLPERIAVSAPGTHLEIVVPGVARESRVDVEVAEEGHPVGIAVGTGLSRRLAQTGGHGEFCRVRRRALTGHDTESEGERRNGGKEEPGSLVLHID